MSMPKLTPSGIALLAEAFLSGQEWYKHGQSGMAAKALCRACLCDLRSGTFDHDEKYVAPAMRLNEDGKRLASVVCHDPEVYSQACRMLKAKGLEPKE